MVRAHHFEGVNVMVNFLCPHCKHRFTRCVDHPLMHRDPLKKGSEEMPNECCLAK